MRTNAQTKDTGFSIAGMIDGTGGETVTVDTTPSESATTHAIASSWAYGAQNDLDKAIKQVATLPTAAATEAGNRYLYTGATGGGLTNGYIYVCQESSTPGTYEWVVADTQPHGLVEVASVTADGVKTYGEIMAELRLLAPSVLTPDIIMRGGNSIFRIDNVEGTPVRRRSLRYLSFPNLPSVHTVFRKLYSGKNLRQ